MKKNRIFKTISGAALCTALLTGCSESWLEPKPLSFLTPENAYVDADGLLTSLAAAERSMRHEYFGNGGIVTMFTFVNFAMTCATNRYLSFELGKNNIENVNKVFSTSIIIHVVIAIFIFLLGETIGLWFLNTQMTIH